MDRSHKVICITFNSSKLLVLFFCFFFYRTVASSLSEIGETAMCTTDNTDMTDVDMASIAENELCEKFSVTGTSTRSSGGVKKVVSCLYI